MTAGRKEILVYTSIVGGYDRLIPPLVVSDRCHYVCFSDDPDLEAPDPWQVKNACSLTKRTNRQNSRVWKFHPPPWCDKSIWLDANMEIVGDVTKLFDVYMLDSRVDIATFAHPDWNDIYREIAKIVERHKDTAANMAVLRKRYQAAGVPTGLPLRACTVIARRHTEEVADFCQRWAAEYWRGPTKRDQPSFNMLLWKLEQEGRPWNIATIPGDMRNNEFFKMHKHGS